MAFAVQMKGLGSSIVPGDVLSDGNDQLFEGSEDAATDLILVMSRKKRSTMLSHEAEVGVK